MPASTRRALVIALSAAAGLGLVFLALLAALLFSVASGNFGTYRVGPQVAPPVQPSPPPAIGK